MEFGDVCSAAVEIESLVLSVRWILEGKVVRFSVWSRSKLNLKM